jgi:putative Ca2+/H+ antiporter (TMEM165/GDT1 family)
MEWKILTTVFVSVFIAEMADKTQLVTLLFASDKSVSKMTVFVAAAAALVLTTAIGVAAGAVLSEVINPRIMSLVAGIGFIVIGAWVLYSGYFAVSNGSA